MHRPASIEPPRAVLRRWPLYLGGGALVLAVLLGVLIVVRQQSGLIGLDEEWAEEMLDIRGPVGTALALFFDTAGGHLVGTYVVPAVITILLFVFKRRWAAFYFLVTTLASALGVQILKHLFGRARPEDMLVTSDFGSFPSGHVANAVTMAVTLSVIFPVVWVWIAGAAWSIMMALSRTYLGAHWLTDTLGGALVGVGVALLLWLPFAASLTAERRGPPSTGTGAEPTDADTTRAETATTEPTER